MEVHPSAFNGSNAQAHFDVRKDQVTARKAAKAHFVNHALGLVSVEVMDRVLQVIYDYWASRLGTLLLYGAFAIHYSLALWALWQRRSLRMPAADATQLVLGFCIPFLLTEHVLQTRVADTFYGADYGYYAPLLYTFFVLSPWRGALQLTVLVVAWVHAMLGFRFWLRLKPWYPRWQPLLFAFALLLPTFAILGFFEGGREVMDSVHWMGPYPASSRRS